MFMTMDMFIHIFISINMNIYMRANNERLVLCLKLIAETEEENLMLPGLSALLFDLGVLSTEYRTDEAYAATFWSAAELSYLFAEEHDLTKEEAAYLLEELEPFLCVTQSSAGVRLIERTLDKNLSRIKRLANAQIQGR